MKDEQTSIEVKKDDKENIENENDDDDDDEKGILIASDSYDCLICSDCVENNDLIKARRGTEGWMTIEVDNDGTSRVVGREKKDQGQEVGLEVKSQKSRDFVNGDVKSEIIDGITNEMNGLKRKMDSEGLDHDEKDEKKIKVEYGIGPLLNDKKGKGDVFLCHGVREKLKLELTVSLRFPFSRFCILSLSQGLSDNWD